MPYQKNWKPSFPVPNRFAMFPKGSVLGKAKCSPCPPPGCDLPVVSLRQDVQILTFVLLIRWVAQPNGDQDQEDKERPGHFQQQLTLNGK